MNDKLNIDIDPTVVESGKAQGDEPMSNHSDNPHFSTLLDKRLSRRSMLSGSITAVMAGLFFATAGVPGTAEARNVSPVGSRLRGGRLNPTLGFEALPPTRSDTATLPFGYQAQTLAPWGTPLTGSYPAYKPDGSNTGEEQEQQVGSHHDGMHYFPMPNNPNGHGLLCVNHEYVDQYNLHRGGASMANPRPVDQVRKEVAAHGISVIEVKRDRHSGQWDIVPGRYNRRITANTPMEIRGPVRGSDLVKTKYSPKGTMTRGTLNNCGHGYTPWGTYLTCEENWAGYFVNRTGLPREHSRYGVSTSGGRYRWENAEGGADQYVRFDASVKASDPTLDYRNEPNGQGWIVEIDPFTPNSVPKKRTAMGRFAHEGCWVTPPQVGQPVVFYSGDDSQNEYVYKFVTRGSFRSALRANDNLLDDGTLYVARFNEDGSGEWLPLDIRDRKFRAAAAAKGVTFADQADVLVNTRLAADVVGATKMDRPEWGTVHPQTREVYMTMTNNSSRAAGQVDAANPRGPNPYGHIIRWREKHGLSWSTTFEWDIFLLSGTEGDSQMLPKQGGPALTQESIHASPDGLWLDQNGILWIQTDMSGSQQLSGPFGANQMLAANPITGEIKRFLAGPNDQETTGVVSTPDGKTLFVNFQHPGDRSSAANGFTSNWPDHGAVYRHPGAPAVVANPAGPRPRSSTIVITRTDGGVVGLD